MMISTRGRYALRVLADLAEHRSEGFVPMKDVAARQEISLKYLERIVPLLTRARLLEGQSVEMTLCGEKVLLEKETEQQLASAIAETVSAFLAAL